MLVILTEVTVSKLVGLHLQYDKDDDSDCDGNGEIVLICLLWVVSTYSINVQETIGNWYSSIS